MCCTSFALRPPALFQWNNDQCFHLFWQTGKFSQKVVWRNRSRPRFAVSSTGSNSLCGIYGQKYCSLGVGASGHKPQRLFLAGIIHNTAVYVATAWGLLRRGVAPFDDVSEQFLFIKERWLQLQPRSCWVHAQFVVSSLVHPHSQRALHQSARLQLRRLIATKAHSLEALSHESS